MQRSNNLNSNFFIPKILIACRYHLFTNMSLRHKRCWCWSWCPFLILSAGTFYPRIIFFPFCLSFFDSKSLFTLQKQIKGGGVNSEWCFNWQEYFPPFFWGGLSQRHMAAAVWPDDLWAGEDPLEAAGQSRGKTSHRQVSVVKAGLFPFYVIPPFATFLSQSKPPKSSGEQKLFNHLWLRQCVVRSPVNLFFISFFLPSFDFLVIV